MRRLARPRTRYRRDLERVLTMAEQLRYARSIETACAQAREYARRAPRLHLMRSRLRGPGVRDFFVRVYDSRRRAVVELKEGLRRRALTDDVVRAVCQYCGLSAPRIFDHFLWKARIPELSLYKRNLIPCCRDCNHCKGEQVPFDANGEQQFLHFYEDDVDCIPEVLTASVSIPTASGVPVVTYSVGSSPHPLQRVYENHFHLLNLAERYREQAAVELTRIAQRSRSLSQNRLAATLRQEAADLAELYGPNDYRAALCRALAASQPALSWLRQ